MIGPDGKPLAFEIMLNGKAGEAVAVAWQRTLAKLGIAVSIRSVDSAQYLQRQQRLRLRRHAHELHRRRCRRASSRLAAGARRRATPTARSILPASPTRPSTR